MAVETRVQEERAQEAGRAPARGVSGRAVGLGLQTLRDVANRRPRLPSVVRALVVDLLMSLGTLATDAFQMSFSGNPDELGQWRGYAANGMGCCVLTNALAVRIVADVAGWVVCDDRQQKAFARWILDGLRDRTDTVEIRQVLVAAASSMKRRALRPEMKFRLPKFPDRAEVRFREAGDRLVPYVDFLEGKPPLSVPRVIVGPGWQLANLRTPNQARNHVVQAIHRLLEARELHGTTAAESRSIPYDPR